MSPALSVTTPIYNGEAHVRRCYDSLAAQTFHDWEWVVVDDGSKDGTPGILGDIARGDARVRLFRSEENRGRGAARTRALELVRAPWIVVWDVDDVGFPRRLERIVEAAHEGYDFFCSYVVVVDDDMRVVGVRGFEHLWGARKFRTLTHPSLACRTDLARRIGYSPDLETVGQIGEDKRMIYTLAGLHRGCFHRAPLLVHQPSRGFLRRSIHSNLVGVRTVREMFREGTLPLGTPATLGVLAAWWAKIAVLNGLRVAPFLYPWIMRFRLLGPPARGYELSEKERAFIARAQQPVESLRHETAGRRAVGGLA